MVATLDDEYVVCEETLLCAFRYAIGRQSYVVGNVIRDLSENAELLSSNTRQMMIQEINRRWKINELGHEQDRRQWVNLLKRFEEVEENAVL